MYAINVDLQLVLPACIAVAIVIKICQVLQRVYLHPLSKFPGPKLAAASDWWEFFVDVFKGGGGQYVFVRQRLHDRFGPVIRVAPNELHIRDSGWSKILYGGPGIVRHKPEWLALIFGSEFGSFGSPNHHLHRMRRKAMVPFFSRRSVLSLQPKLDHTVEQLSTNILRRAPNGPVDLKVLFFAFTTDMVTTATLGKPYGMLRNDERALVWYEAHDKFQDLFSLCKQIRWIPKLIIRYRVIARSLSSMGHRTGDLLALYWEIYDCAAEALKGHQGRHKNNKDTVESDHPENLMHTILDSSLPSDQKTQLRLTHETFESFAAGSSTTARILSNAFYFILSDSECSHRVNEEAMRLMPNEEMLPPITELQANEYLTAVIKESLRISALLPISMARIADEPLEYRAYTIPAGTVVGMSYSDILLDEDVYPNPTRFDPNRWLTDDDEHMKAMDDYFVPFGRGTRQCIGMELGYFQLYRIIVTLFRRFDMELYEVQHQRDVEMKSAWFLSEPSKASHGIRVLFRRKCDRS